jgi:hypothetical protein
MSWRTCLGCLKAFFAFRGHSRHSKQISGGKAVGLHFAEGFTKLASKPTDPPDMPPTSL